MGRIRLPDVQQPLPADPSNAIVGSWRLPDRLRGARAGVWVFALAAILDAVLRALAVEGGLELMTQNPLFSIALLWRNVPSAGLVFLPGAVLLGRWSAATRRPAFTGALLLAISELIFLAMTVVPFGPSQSTSAPERIPGLQLVAVAAALLSLAGLVLLFAAVNASRRGDATPAARRWAAAILLVAVATTVAVLPLVGTPSARTVDDIARGLSFGLSDAVIAASRSASGLVTGALAAVAALGWAGARGDRRGWAAIAVGAGVATIVDGIYAGMSVIGPLGVTTSFDWPWPLLFAVLALSYTVTTVSLVVGLAIGLDASRRTKRTASS